MAHAGASPSVEPTPSNTQSLGAIRSIRSPPPTLLALHRNLGLGTTTQLGTLQLHRPPPIFGVGPGMDSPVCPPPTSGSAEGPMGSPIGALASGRTAGPGGAVGAVLLVGAFGAGAMGGGSYAVGSVGVVGGVSSGVLAEVCVPLPSPTSLLLHHPVDGGGKVVVMPYLHTVVCINAALRHACCAHLYGAP